MGIINNIISIASGAIAAFFAGSLWSNILNVLMYVGIALAVITVLVIVGVIVLIVVLVKKHKEKKLAAAVETAASDESDTAEAPSEK